MSDMLKRCLVSISCIAVPTVVGAILGNYLQVAWLAAVFLAVGAFFCLIYLYLGQRFVHIDTDIHTLETEVITLRERLGRGVGNKLSWLDFWSKTQELLSKIEGSGYKPDVVISVGRSGAVIGGILATNLQATRHVAIDRTVVVRRQTEGPGRTDIKIDDTVTPNFTALGGKKVLVVMSECETGLTLSQAYNFLQKNVADITIRTAVLFKRENVHFLPDYFVLSTDENWLDLPFRIDDKWVPHHPRANLTTDRDDEPAQEELGKQ